MRRQLWILSNIFLLGLPWAYRKMFPSTSDDRIHLEVQILLDAWNYPLKDLYGRMKSSLDDKQWGTYAGGSSVYFEAGRMDWRGRPWISFQVWTTEENFAQLEKIDGVNATNDGSFCLLNKEGMRVHGHEFAKCNHCGKYSRFTGEYDDDDQYHYGCGHCEVEPDDEMNMDNLVDLDLVEVKKLLAANKIYLG